MHVGESVSIPDAEKRQLIAFAVKHSAGRVPIIAHATDSGTSIAASLARYAQEAGAAAVMSSTPYYWTPPPAMLLEHFAAIANAITIPFYVHNAPEDMSGAKVNADLMLKLIGRAENFVGAVDSGLDWQFMIELMTEAEKVRPGFQLISGIEYMVSGGAIGATGLVSSGAGVAPKLVRTVYDLCRADKLFEARKAQEDLAALLQALGGLGPSGLKSALRLMKRDCGEPRPPLEPLTSAKRERLAAALGAIPALEAEPRGW